MEKKTKMESWEELYESSKKALGYFKERDKNKDIPITIYKVEPYINEAEIKKELGFAKIFMDTPDTLKESTESERILINKYGETFDITSIDFRINVFRKMSYLIERIKEFVKYKKRDNEALKNAARYQAELTVHLRAAKKFIESEKYELDDEVTDLAISRLKNKAPFFTPKKNQKSQYNEFLKDVESRIPQYEKKLKKYLEPKSGKFKALLRFAKTDVRGRINNKEKKKEIASNLNVDPNIVSATFGENKDVPNNLHSKVCNFRLIIDVHKHMVINNMKIVCPDFNDVVKEAQYYEVYGR